MKHVLAMILALMVSVALCSAQSQCLPIRQVTAENLAFQGGEKLTFRIHFKWGAINSDVARATMTLESSRLNGVEVYNSRLFAQTAKFYDSFFKLREDFRSSFTTDGLVPVKFFRDTREGRYRCTNDYKFVWNVAEPYISADIETSRKPKFNKQIPLNKCTFDVMTLFYTARNMDMNKVRQGVQYPMTFAVADDVYSICFVYKGRETIDVKGLGKVKTMKFSVQVVEGDVFTGESDMFLWFSDDDNRIPVYFEAPLKIGMVCGRLEETENLKFPFKTE